MTYKKINNKTLGIATADLDWAIPLAITWDTDQKYGVPHEKINYAKSLGIKNIKENNGTYETFLHFDFEENLTKFLLTHG